MIHSNVPFSDKLSKFSNIEFLFWNKGIWVICLENSFLMMKLMSNNSFMTINSSFVLLNKSVTDISLCSNKLSMVICWYSDKYEKKCEWYLSKFSTDLLFCSSLFPLLSFS